MLTLVVFFLWTCGGGGGGSAPTEPAGPIAPLAQNITASTSEDVTFSFNLIATSTVAVTYATMSNPTNGTATLSGAAVTYTPNTNWHGTDSFTYLGSNSGGNSNIATVTITVIPVDDAPVTLNASATTDEDTAVDIALTAEEYDGQSIQFNVVSDAPNGSVSISGLTATYTPNQDWSGTDTFTFEAVDASSKSMKSVLNTGTATVTVNNLNPNPVTLGNLSSAWNGTELQLSWSQSDEVYFGGYKIWEDDDPSFSSASVIGEISGVTTTTLDYSATPGTKYYYFVQTLDSYGGSSESNVEQGDTFYRFEFSYSSGRDSDDRSRDVFPTSDGGFIIVGSSCGVSSDCDGTMLKINLYGVVEWMTSIGHSTNDDVIYDAIELSNGDIAVVGFTAYPASSWGDDVLVGRYTASGSNIWIYAYDVRWETSGGTFFGTADRAYDLLEDSNGDLFVFGGSTMFTGATGNEMDGMIMTVDSSGNYQGLTYWDDFVGDGIDSFWGGADHSPLWGDDMGFLQSRDQTSLDYRSHIAYFTSTMDGMSWVNEYSAGEETYVYDVQRHGNWHALSTSYQGSDTAGVWGYENVGFDGTTIDFQNRLNVTNSPSYQDIYARTLTPTADGNFLVSGAGYHTADEKFYGMFAKSLVAGGFEYVWSVEAHGQANRTLFETQTMSDYDGGVLVAGQEWDFTSSNNGHSFYVVKYDNEGNKVQLDFYPGAYRKDMSTGYRSKPKRSTKGINSSARVKRFDGRHDNIGEDVTNQIRAMQPGEDNIDIKKEINRRVTQSMKEYKPIRSRR
jgi:hypothetical protein